MARGLSNLKATAHSAPLHGASATGRLLQDEAVPKALLDGREAGRLVVLDGIRPLVNHFGLVEVVQEGVPRKARRAGFCYQNNLK